MYLYINGDIMEDKKINPLLTGSAETMLQSFYEKPNIQEERMLNFMTQRQ